MNVGENIKRIRKEKGITQKELGEKLGVSQSAIGQFESCNSNLKTDTIIKIADALGVSMFDIMNFNSTIDLAYEILDNSTTLDHLDLAEKIGNIAKKKYQEKYPLEIQLIAAFDDLNDNGKQKAVEQVELLTKIPEYRKEDSPDQD